MKKGEPSSKTKNYIIPIVNKYCEGKLKKNSKAIVKKIRKYGYERI